MKTTQGTETTPLKAAKRAYVLLGQQAELDEDDALEAADIEAATPKERADFRRHLQTVDRRVRKMLRV
jgi:hypothetical protein